MNCLVIKSFLTCIDGKYYGLPFYEGFYNLMYDVDLFDKEQLFFDEDAVIDCETGDIVINYSTREIEEMDNNIYKMNKIVFYIDSNKQLIYL